jgi:hypothetical protein
VVSSQLLACGSWQYWVMTCALVPILAATFLLARAYVLRKQHVLAAYRPKPPPPDPDLPAGAPSAANGYGIITLLKDITIGTVFGVLTISFLIFLDHINVIHLQSAHNFRQSAFSVLNDPETLATLEESAGLKFIPIGDYEAMKNEIDAAAAKVAKVKDTIAERIKETEQKKAELEPLKAEYEKLLKESKLELDKWCGECSWLGGTSCDARKQYFIDQYGNTEILSKVAIMKQSPGCKKTD